MRSFSLFLIVCLLPSGSRADDPGPTTPAIGQRTSEANASAFDGIWRPKGAMLAGVLLPPPALKAITLKIEGDRYEVTVEGEKEPDRGTFTLDEMALPKRMAITSTSGPNKGKTILAIYENKNANAMRVCYDLTGKEYPKEFKAPKGTQFYLVGYRRQELDVTGISEDEGANRQVPFEIGNPDRPTDLELTAFAKIFCVAMRRNGQKDVEAFREFIDPLYLEKYDLKKGSLLVETAPVVSIYDIQVAEDMRTILCILGTRRLLNDQELGKEAILLRVTVRDENLYLSPGEAPDAETGSFTPWILRMNL